MFRPVLKLRGAVSLKASLFVIPSRCTSLAANDQGTDRGWDTARPFDDLPVAGGLEMVRKFAPGGRYHNCTYLDIHRRMREDYGNIFRYVDLFGRRDMVLSFRPDDFEKIFRNEGPMPVRRGLETLSYYRQKVRSDVFKGYGLVCEHGEPWQRLRSIVNPVMMHPKIMRQYVSKLDSVTHELIQIMKSNRNEQNELPASFNDWVKRWALETTGVFALDTKLRLFDKNTPMESTLIVQLVDDWFALCYKLEILPSLWRYFKTPTLRKQIKTLDKLTEIIMAKVEEAVVRLESNPTASSQQSVLEKLLKVDKDMAIIMAYDMLLAALDTTFSSSIATLYLLAKHPEKQNKLREELRSILPNKNSTLTPDSIRDVPYLRACIKEGLRIYPPVVGNSRTTSKNLVLQGYRIPKGTDVLMASMTLQQESRYFVRGDEFIPERWLKDHQFPVAPEANPFVFQPFGFGVRACIGQRFANLQLELIVARITRNFEYRWNYDDLRIRSSIVNMPENEMKFEMVEVDMWISEAS